MFDLNFFAWKINYGYGTRTDIPKILIVRSKESKARKNVLVLVIRRVDFDANKNYVGHKIEEDTIFTCQSSTINRSPDHYKNM